MGVRLRLVRESEGRSVYESRRPDGRSGWATGRFRGKRAQERRRKTVQAVQSPEQERIIAQGPVVHVAAPRDEINLFISGKGHSPVLRSQYPLVVLESAFGAVHAPVVEAANAAGDEAAEAGVEGNGRPAAEMFDQGKSACVLRVPITRVAVGAPGLTPAVVAHAWIGL